MHEPTYRQALSHGWQMAKDHKLLWIFGLFATFLGQMGLLDLVAHLKLTDQHYTLYPALAHLGDNARFLLEWVATSGLPVASVLWLFWIIIVLVGAWLMLLFASVSSQGALIHGMAQFATSRKKNKHVDVDRAWHAGTSHFWRLLALNIVKKLGILISVALVGLASVNIGLGGATTGDQVLFFITLVFTVLVGAVLSLLVIYAAGYVVIEEMNLHDAIDAAWKLFRDHWLVSLEVAVVILVMNIIAGAVGVLATALFIGEMAVVWAGALVLGSSFLWHVGFVLSSFLLLLFIVFIGTMLTVFTTAVWTYLFMVMHKKGIKSRVLHFLRLHRDR